MDRKEAVLRERDAAQIARDRMKQELVLTRMIADDPFGAEVAYATQRMRTASARVDAVNEQLSRLLKS